MTGDQVVDRSEALLERDTSPNRRVLAEKLAALAELDLDFLAVVNPGCQRQMIAAVRRAHLRTRVVHPAELVAPATAETPLPAPTPAATSASAPAPPPPAESTVQ